MGFPQKTTLILITIFWLFIIAGSIPNTAVITALCNSGMYSQGDPFVISLDYVVAELERATPTSKNYDFFNVSPFPNAFAYGHATCNLNLTSSDCATCLGAAKTTMFGTCQSRIGARTVLQDCTIRYEQYPITNQDEG
ncbi:antifungal protein ginkbilobin-like protein [Juglans microcarpa x Juglans regia]|uniref:antifungal protein ginkbilobin-like protein n=1 Tax=Juglans microcarpa x Juglans regia TaxID=2249226 RepID=UPI001B7E23F1|nr:antifungal protein ginkbilobin-like protein [Juglans microcarpa x Juglans regia]